MPYPPFNQYSAFVPSQTGQYGYTTTIPSTQQMMSQPTQQTPIHGFIYVTGLDGAKAYPMPPNSEMPLFDSTGDVLYIKTTDGAGFPTITVCDCKKRGQADVSQGEYVTHDDLDQAYRDLSAQIEQMRGVINGLVPAAPEPGVGAHAANQVNAG